jgi:hypothetical protein
MRPRNANDPLELPEDARPRRDLNDREDHGGGREPRLPRVGPKLAGAPISLGAAKAQIDNGGSAMPPKLVQGGQEEDVLAYLATIFQRGS